MTYTDGINHYIGDCIYANHDINFKTLDYLLSEEDSNISAELTELCTNAGLNFRNVAPQAAFNSGTSDFTLLTFAADSDTINSRYTFDKVNSVVGASSPFSDGSSIYNDIGYEPTNNSLSSSNKIIYAQNSQSYPRVTTGGNVITQWAGVANSDCLALFSYSVSKSVPTNYSYHFWYAGVLGDINTNFNYYSNNQQTKSVCFYFANINGSYTYYGGKHFIANTEKNLLQTGKAAYSIVCSDAQIPNSQWATTFYAYDDDTSIGDPIIGRVQNLLVAQGTYNIAKPVQLNTPVGDGGSNFWLPVGSFADKTVLMRCYSSV